MNIPTLNIWPASWRLLWPSQAVGQAVVASPAARAVSGRGAWQSSWWVGGLEGVSPLGGSYHLVCG